MYIWWCVLQLTVTSDNCVNFMILVSFSPLLMFLHPSEVGWMPFIFYPIQYNKKVPYLCNERYCNSYRRYLLFWGEDGWRTGQPEQQINLIIFLPTYPQMCMAFTDECPFICNDQLLHRCISVKYCPWIWLRRFPHRHNPHPPSPPAPTPPSSPLSRIHREGKCSNYFQMLGITCRWRFRSGLH